MDENINKLSKESAIEELKQSKGGTIMMWIFIIILVIIILVLLGLIVWKYISVQNVIKGILEQIKLTPPVNNFPDGFDQSKPFVYLPSNPENYDQTVAQTLIETADIASSYNLTPHATNAPPNFIVANVYNSYYTKGKNFVAAVTYYNATDSSLIVAFSGSVTASQIDADFIFELIVTNSLLPSITDTSVKSHKGFTTVYANMKNSLTADITNYVNNGLKNIIFTGHSLGGALVTLAVLDLSSIIQNTNITIYTYGSPRVGNTNFVNLYNLTYPNTMRINNTEDIIPQIPIPGFAGYDYEHVNNNIPFTISLGTISDNHNLSYINNLPQCFVNKAVC